MTQPPTDDFSRYELLVLHRLKCLEDETKTLHSAFEDLRVELVTVKADISHAAEEKARATKASAARIATAVSLVVGLAGALAPHFL